MSRKIGLCDTHFETDVDGDVDFEFFGGEADQKPTIAAAAPEVNNNANAHQIPPCKAGEGLEVVEDDQRSSPLSSSSSSSCCSSSSSSSSSSSQRYNCSDFESDSEITDVSPLSSANMSPLPTDSPKPIRERSATTTTSSSYKSPKKREDPVDMKLLAKAIVEMDEQRSCCSKTVASSSSSTGSSCRTTVAKPKKNRSFSAEETRRIELENQRLLRRLLQHQQRKPSSGAKGGPGSGGDLQARKVAHSAVNRRRKQQQIEDDNLGLLKRLQAAKPTKELSRNYLLRDASSKGAPSQARPATCPSSHSCPSLPTARDVKPNSCDNSRNSS